MVFVKQENYQQHVLAIAPSNVQMVATHPVMMALALGL
jgi:hypothetical protein